jgi:hypothetical protein
MLEEIKPVQVIISELGEESRERGKGFSSLLTPRIGRDM